MHSQLVNLLHVLLNIRIIIFHLIIYRNFHSFNSSSTEQPGPATASYSQPSSLLLLIVFHLQGEGLLEVLGQGVCLGTHAQGGDYLLATSPYNIIPDLLMLR